MGIIDVHSHLDMPQFESDLAEVLNRAAEAGVGRIICVGTDLASSQRCIELARQFPDRVHAAVGIHPNHLAAKWNEDPAEAEVLCTANEVVAVGETGLDFHHDSIGRQEQITAFRAHIRLALATDKPIIIHSRKADEEVLRVLSRASERLRGVRHCFDGSPDIAERYVELGFHISFGGSITRPGYKELKAAARAVRADRLLVETDCPYQTPASRAGMRNEPAFIVETVEALSALRRQTPEDTARMTTENAEALFFVRNGGL
ncbi:MAG: TatD family hydrolase [Planctomycetota bacterium]|jgi:TatD DNase family protein